MAKQLVLFGGLGDGFLQMYTDPSHRSLEEFKRKHPEESITVRVVTNSAALPELYAHHPCVDRIVVESQTEYILQGRTLPASDSLGDYRPQAPKFYLTPEEQHFVEGVTTPFVFLHLYSTTPYKKLIPPLNPIKLVDYIIDKLGYHVVYFGKSQVFDAHSHARGYPSCVEVLEYERPGLLNFTTTAQFNNPRVGHQLLAKATFAVLAESGYLQAATYLGTRMLILLGPNTESSYKQALDHVYFKAFQHAPYVAIQKFRLDMLLQLCPQR